jgi:hypothetical protein
MPERNPAEILPRTWFDRMFRYFVFRNQWKDETDLIVSILTCARNDGGEQVMVWGYGMKLGFCQIGTWGTVGHYDPKPDGSAIVSFPKGETFFAVDFSRVCGAELVVAAVGKGAVAGKNAQGNAGASATCTSLTAGGKPWAILTVQTGAAPAVKAEGDQIVVGNRTLAFDGQKIVLGQL